MAPRTLLPIAKLIIVMVGLPARGKSYITKKLARYLNWLQLETMVFNVGERRRAKLSWTQMNTAGCPAEITPTQINEHSAEFFDPSNRDGVRHREEAALTTLQELLLWLQEDNNTIAIFDATNSTYQRRCMILAAIHEKFENSVEVLFLESCCFDEAILEQNMRLKLKGPDYIGKDVACSLADFRRRVQMYEKSYEPLGVYEEERQIAYLKLIDVGRKFVAFNTGGYLTSQTIEFLVNFHLSERQIWLTRNGESDDDYSRRIGRNSPLTESGLHYARSLAHFIDRQRVLWEQQKRAKGPSERSVTLNVWTSMMTQAIQTAQFFDSTKYDIKNSPLLNDLHAGRMTGMTFGEIESTYPAEIADRRCNPVTYRWPGPGGEAHSDVIHRLRGIILELERTKEHILLITHRAVMRVLLTYFANLSKDRIASLQVPLHTLYSVTPQAYGVSVQCFAYDEVSQSFYPAQDDICLI